MATKGTDTAMQIGAVDFLGDGETMQLDNLMRAWDTSLQVIENDTVEWNLTYDGGQADENGDVELEFFVETGGSALSASDATVLGFDSSAGDVYATSYGHVQVRSDGTYEYKAGSVKGTDSFDFPCDGQPRLVERCDCHGRCWP